MRAKATPWLIAAWLVVAAWLLIQEQHTWRFLLMAVVAYPLVEEAIFRGALWDGLLWVAGKTRIPEKHRVALVAVETSILFAFAHSFKDHPLVTPQFLIGVFLMGMLFGVMRQYLGLGAAIAAHGLSNAFVYSPAMMPIAKWVSAMLMR